MTQTPHHRAFPIIISSVYNFRSVLSFFLLGGRGFVRAFDEVFDDKFIRKSRKVDLHFGFSVCISFALRVCPWGEGELTVLLPPLHEEREEGAGAVVADGLYPGGGLRGAGGPRLPNLPYVPEQQSLVRPVDPLLFQHLPELPRLHDKGAVQPERQPQQDHHHQRRQNPAVE